MQYRVTEFLLEDIFVEELFDASRNDRLLQNLIDVHSFAHVNNQHLCHQRLELAGKVGRKSRIATPHDLHGKKVH